MLDILTGGVAGTLLGGLFRLAPEILKWVDKKDERKHELSMFEHQCTLELQRGNLKLDEIGANHQANVDTGVLQAFNSAIESQTQMAVAAGGWAAKISASVRPVITYWVLLLWTLVHFWFAVTAYQSGQPALVVFHTMMTPDMSALVSGTINFWFLDRTLQKRGL